MKIRTYADGYGNWYAVVPTIGTVKSQRERARRAITTMVRQRQGDQGQWSATFTRVKVY